MERIRKEIKMADHLFYVSMKYTKTCDVMLNLIERWKKAIEYSVEILLERAKKKKAIKKIPKAPFFKVRAVEKIFKREKIVKETLALYRFFKKIPSCEILKEHEFRKNITLRIINHKEEEINMARLVEWRELLESFINFVTLYK